jgi:hypothetical protein
MAPVVKVKKIRSDYSLPATKEGQFKYLILAPKHQNDPESMLCFHLVYSADSFEAVTEDPFWEAMVTPSTTTIAQIMNDISGFPSVLYADFFVP